MTASCVGMTIVGITFITIGAILPLLRTRFFLSELEAGYLASSLPFGILIGSMTFGPISDRYSYKYPMSGSLLLSILGLVGLAFFTSISMLMFCFILVGIGSGALNGSTNSLVSIISSETPEKRAANLSFLSIFFGVGALLMPLIMGYFTEFYSYNSILLLLSVILLVPFLAFLFLKYPEPVVSGKLEKSEITSLLRDPRLMILGLFLFSQSGIEGIVNNWTPLFMESVHKMGSSAAIYSLTIFLLSLTITRVALSTILKDVAVRTLLFSSVIVVSIGLSILSSGYLTMGLIIMGVGSASAFPLAFSYVGEFFNRMSGMAFSIVLIYGLLGNMLLNYLMGFLSEKFGLEIYSWFIGLSILATAVLLVIFYRIIYRLRDHKS